MSINPMNNHYSFTTPASIHDEEALTALELAGRTAAKVNETVKAFNDLEKETDDHLAEQDAAIKKMNDVTMPQKVDEAIDKHIADGDFDETIREYSAELEVRVNNLLGQIVEGSTTTAMDAEIIDARVDNQNITHASLGEAVRSTDKLNQIRLNASTKLTYEAVDKVTSNGYYIGGMVHANDSYRCHEVSVTPGEVYIYDIIYGYNVIGALLYDAEGNIVRSYHQDIMGSHRINKTFPLVIPSGVTKLIVNTAAIKTVGGVSYFGDVWRVTGATLNDEYITEYVDKRFDLLNGNPIVGDDVPGELAENSFIYAETEIPTYISGDKYSTLTCAVTPGDIIYVEGSASYKNFVYTFYGNGVSLGVNLRDADSDKQIIFNGEVRVPANADTIHVASETATPAVKYITGYKGSTDFTGLKWCVLGDSLTEKNERATKVYHEYVADKTGVTVVNLGVSGAGYKNQQSEKKAIIDQVDAIPLDADCVTIFGSGNDMGHTLGDPTDTGTTTVCGCINRTIDKIYARFPLMQIGIVSPTPWDAYNPANGSNKMALYSEALRQICLNRGIPFLDLYHCSGLRPWDENFRGVAYTRDPEGTGCHPDENGHKMIAPKFYEFLRSLIGTY